MKTTILLCIVVLMAGVMLIPSEPAMSDGPVITRATVSHSPRSFKMDDGTVVELDRRVIIAGSNFLGAERGPAVRFFDERGKGMDATVAILRDNGRIEAWPPAGTRGRMTLVVANPDGNQASASIEF